MLRYSLTKAASNGWKLHSVVNSRAGESSPIGQTVLIFERRIKAEE